MCGVASGGVRFHATASMPSGRRRRLPRGTSDRKVSGCTSLCEQRWRCCHPNCHSHIDLRELAQDWRQRGWRLLGVAMAASVRLAGRATGSQVSASVPNPRGQACLHVAPASMRDCALITRWLGCRPLPARAHPTHAPSLPSTSSTSSCRSPHGVTQVVLKGVEDADDDGSSAALVILHGAARLRFRVQCFV